MWQVFPKLGLLKALFLMFSALFLGVLLVAFSPESGVNLSSWSQFSKAFGLATPVTLAFISIIWVIGKFGWLLLWKCPGLGEILHKHVCPNLNGKWVGEIYSNYAEANGDSITKEVELNIKADLFGFNISLRSIDDYQNSKIVFSEMYRDPRTNTFYLYYIFEASVPNPEETDDRLFEGACKLEVILNDSTDTLKGIYWTNRRWQRKYNTAGLISVSKSSS